MEIDPAFGWPLGLALTLTYLYIHHRERMRAMELRTIAQTIITARRLLIQKVVAEAADDREKWGWAKSHFAISFRRLPIGIRADSIKRLYLPASRIIKRDGLIQHSDFPEEYLRWAHWNGES